MPKALGLIETRGLVAAIAAADTMLKTADVTLAGKELADAGLVTIKILGDTASVIAAVEAAAVIVPQVGTLISKHVILRPDDAMSVLLPELKEDFIPAKQPKKKDTPAVKAEDTSVNPNNESELQAEPAEIIKSESSGKGSEVVSVKLKIENKPKEKQSLKIQEEKPKQSVDIKEEKPSALKVVKKEKAAAEKPVKPEKPVPVKNTEKKSVKQDGVKKPKEAKEIKAMPEFQGSLFEVENDTIARLREEALGKREAAEEDAESKEEIIAESAAEAVDTEPAVSSEVEGVNPDEMDVHSLRRFARSIKGFPIQGRQISKANRKELLDYFHKLK